MKLFKQTIRLSLLALFLSMLAACNTGEGTGGTGVIEGTVYKMLHPDDYFNLETDTILAPTTMCVRVLTGSLLSKNYRQLTTPTSSSAKMRTKSRPSSPSPFLFRNPISFTGFRTQ